MSQRTSTRPYVANSTLPADANPCSSGLGVGWAWVLAGIIALPLNCRLSRSISGGMTGVQSLLQYHLQEDTFLGKAAVPQSTAVAHKTLN